MHKSTPLRYAVGLIFVLAASAQASESMPYPQGPMSADEIARQVYTAAHGGLVQNAISKRKGRDVAVVVNRAPLAMRTQDRIPGVQTFDTYVNNSPRDPAIETLQMAILTSGRTKGTGVLFTRYADRDKGAIISMWLPALRKIRRINEPSHEDVWFGTNLTYGELVLRGPDDEVHELLGEGKVEGCLGAMALKHWEKNRYTLQLPGPQCAHIGKPVYRLKSATKFKNWWYDYHISEIDKRTFALYQTVYYKGAEKIKTVYIDWQSLDQPDPRITYPRYIYALTHADGKDSMVYVPRSTISLNLDLADDFWSEETLRTYGR
ncbi:MAG: outer membrane lipoprotein-sorting protein [Candidatus Thiodiazotropha sp. (ex Dulcina madagascariensis)]|nr:outer membrane lipoprotein-sorting protein [Candidatus Thiodiazotropha sp. (ex Dulcina madagascariensis)]